MMQLKYKLVFVSIFINVNEKIIFFILQKHTETIHYNYFDRGAAVVSTGNSGYP